MICELTLIINLSKEPINSDDNRNKEVATKRCSQLYKDAPCLKKFIKVEANVYRAICGEGK